MYGVDIVYSVSLKRLHCSIYFRSQEVPGGDKFQIVKDSVGNNLSGWSATTSLSVIPVCNPEQEEFSGCHMAGNVMCFRSNEEDMNFQGSVADSSGCHIPAKAGSDLGPWNYGR